MNQKKKTEKKAKDSNSISFKDSIKTKLITIMILVTAIPLLVAISVSYVSSTNKAVDDSKTALLWQARYLGSEFGAILEKNMSTIQAIASSPATIMYFNGGGDENLYADMLQQLKDVDTIFDDGNFTVITGADGMQLVRSDEGELVDVSEREYFQRAASGQPYMSGVIASASTGQMISVIIAPITDSDGNFIGSIQRNYNLEAFHEFLESEADDAFIADREGVLAAHSQFAITPDEELKSVANEQFMTTDETEGFYESENQENHQKSYLAFYKEPKTSFVIGVSTPKSTVMASARSAAYIVIIIGLVLLILAIIISFMMARSFTEPIQAVKASLAELAEGRFKKVEKHDRRKDEFGSISKATNSVIATLDGIVSNIKNSAEDVGSSSEELSEMANQISHTAEDVANAVQEIATGAAQQADEIQDATHNVERIGDAVGDVQSSTGDLSSLADKMKKASEVSSKSLASLQDSSAEMTEKIDEISRTIASTQTAVSNINEKVEGITSIATQTNLLSLNASIEAARAGEAGRGFAVVAEEIGKLAEDSKTMADDIRKEMAVLLEEAEAAVVAAEDVKDGNNNQQVALGETLDAVNGMLSDIGSTVGGVQLISQGADTCESSKNAVVDTMSTLSAISEENAASSEETGASMQELSATVTTLATSANNLKEIADKLNEEMKFFK
ncbi:MAG: methyl-accepting chemotaxis protein [Lachnospiraceae bacterium]|nr:methyl-accepting chemotaxis protein [Lachnospiraceae bacterium]